MGGLLIAEPVPLSVALKSNFLLEGDQLTLLAGICHGDYIYARQPIKISQNDSDRAIIDGSFTLSGDSSELVGLEITSSAFTDRTAQVYPTGNVFGPGKSNKMTDCILHDNAQGLYVADEAGDGVVIDGCIIYHNGWIGLDRGHGHGLYIQNAGDNPLIIQNCILFDGFGYNLHAYGEGSQKLNNIQFINNISFCAESLCYPTFDARPNLLAGGYNNVLLNPLWRGNMTYGGVASVLGYLSTGIVNGIVDNNYLPEGITISDPDNVTLSNNVTAPEETNRVFVIPVRGRAHVAAYNWEGLDAVAVDLTSVTGLIASDSVTVRNVQDYFVDIQTLTLDANKCISVDMRAANRSVAAPIGWTAPATTFPTFGCFVVEKA